MEVTKVCKYCNKEFTYKKYKGAERKYCCLECQRMATTKAHYRNNPQRLSTYSQRGYISRELYLRYGGKCAICGWRASEELITVKGRTQYSYGNELHHIITVEDGGLSTEDNLILLCPNHHKQANLGLISIDTLKSYLKQPPTKEEKQQMSNQAADTVARAIFG